MLSIPRRIHPCYTRSSRSLITSICPQARGCLTSRQGLPLRVMRKPMWRCHKPTKSRSSMRRRTRSLSSLMSPLRIPEPSRSWEINYSSYPLSRITRHSSQAAPPMALTVMSAPSMPSSMCLITTMCCRSTTRQTLFVTRIFQIAISSSTARRTSSAFNR